MSCIGNMSLAILMIGTDSMLAAIESDTTGGVQYRLSQYGDKLGRLDNIVRTFRHETGRHMAPFSLSPRVHIFPTCSRNRFVFMLDAYRLGAQLLKSREYHVIAVQDASLAAVVALLLRQRFGIPISVTVYGDHIDNPLWLREGLAVRVLNRLSKWILKRSDTIRVDSQLVKQKLVALGIAPERIWAYPVFIRWIDKMNQGDRNRLRQQLEIGDAPLVLCVGRLVAQKNVANLIEAFALLVRQIPEARCLIVGGGEEEAHLRSLVVSKGLDKVVIFTGTVEYSTLVDCYAACDVLALPSNYEGIARVLIEASAAERPAVATNVGGTSEIVLDGETGLLVPPGDSMALAIALCHVLGDRVKSATMGVRARERVLSEYTEEKLLPKYIDIWRYTAMMARNSKSNDVLGNGTI